MIDYEQMGGRGTHGLGAMWVDFNWQFFPRVPNLSTIFDIADSVKYLDRKTSDEKLPDNCYSFCRIFSYQASHRPAKTKPCTSEHYGTYHRENLSWSVVYQDSETREMEEKYIKLSIIHLSLCQTYCKPIRETTYHRRGILYALRIQ